MGLNRYQWFKCIGVSRNQIILEKLLVRNLTIHTLSSSFDIMIRGSNFGARLIARILTVKVKIPELPWNIIVRLQLKRITCVISIIVVVVSQKLAKTGSVEVPDRVYCVQY